MSNFQARTRVRGEVTYYLANWLDGHFEPRKYGVLFLEGKHKGRIFKEEACVIAKDDAWQKI